MGKVVVLGGGESGCGAALLAQQKGFEVFLSDIGKIKEKYKNVLTHNAIEWEEEKHSEMRFFEADIIVKSPGIPDTIPLIQDLKKLQCLSFLKLNLRHDIQMQKLLVLRVVTAKPLLHY